MKKEKEIISVTGQCHVTREKLLMEPRQIMVGPIIMSCIFLSHNMTKLRCVFEFNLFYRNNHSDSTSFQKIRNNISKNNPNQKCTI